jgi:hypothetical protein
VTTILALIRVFLEGSGILLYTAALVMVVGVASSATLVNCAKLVKIL